MRHSPCSAFADEPMSAELKRSEIDGSEHLSSSMGGDGGAKPADGAPKLVGADIYVSIVSGAVMAGRDASSGGDWGE